MTIKRKSKLTDSAKSNELKQAEKTIREQTSVSLSEKNDIASMAENKTEQAIMEKELIDDKVAKQSVAEAKKNINKEVPAQYLNSRPSGGVTEGSVTYHMRETYAFMLGRRNPKPELIGLFAAAARLKTIVQGYYADCPYACWKLVELEQEITDLKKQMKLIEQEAIALVNHSSNVVIKKFEAKRPTNVMLSFAEPYAYHIADLLVQYDDILRIMLKYKEKQFISYEEYATIENKMAKPLRRILNTTTKWYYVGREAVLEQNAKNQQAEASMGILPDEIINDKIKPTMIAEKLQTPRNKIS